MNASPKGRRGEDKAAGFLGEEGFVIVERNYVVFGAEIDIVAERSGVLVFVEVKNWNAYGYEELGRAVDRRKRRRLIRAARGFVASHEKFENHRIRFDVIFINGDTIEHTEDAFTETDAL